MSGEPREPTVKIEVEAIVVPRHYRLKLASIFEPLAMLELATSLDVLAGQAPALFSDDVAGGWFKAVKAAIDEAYTGDRPQPIVVPDALPETDASSDGDEPDGGTPAKV